MQLFLSLTNLIFKRILRKTNEIDIIYEVFLSTLVALENSVILTSLHSWTVTLEIIPLTPQVFFKNDNCQSKMVYRKSGFILNC